LKNLSFFLSLIQLNGCNGSLNNQQLKW